MITRPRLRLLILTLLLVIGASAVAEDEVQESPVAPWRCYLGTDATLTKHFLTLKQEIQEGWLWSRMPDYTDDHGAPLNTIRWRPKDADTTGTVEEIATCYGKRLYRVFYRDSDPIEKQTTVVFLLETHDGFVRPFFVLHSDENSTITSSFECSKRHPFALVIRSDWSGTGGNYNLFYFNFERGRPNFLYRVDGGRQMEPEESR